MRRPGSKLLILLLVTSAFSACDSGSFRFTRNKSNNSGNGNPSYSADANSNIWTPAQLAQAQQACVNSPGNVVGNPVQIEDFCRCLIDRAMNESAYSYEDYSNPNNSARQEQSKNGQEQECMDIALIKKKSAVRQWAIAKVFNNDKNDKESKAALVDSMGRDVLFYSSSVDEQVYNLYQRTRDRGIWQDPVLVGTDMFSYLETASTPAGDMIAGWTSKFDSNLESIVYINRYDRLTKQWGTQEIVNTNNQGGLFHDVAMDPNGNIAVVWDDYEADTTTAVSTCFLRRWRKSTGWGAIETLPVTNCMEPQVKFDAQGQILILSLSGSTDFNSSDLVYTRVPFASAVGTFTSLETRVTGVLSGYIYLETDGKSNFTAVWRRGQRATGDTFIYPDGLVNAKVVVASLKAGSNQWQVSQNFSSTTLTRGDTLNLSMNTKGDAVTSWAQTEGAGTVIYGSKFTLAEGWSAPVKIETTANAEKTLASRPNISLNDAGEMVTIWVKVDAKNPAMVGIWGAYSRDFKSFLINKVSDPAAGGLVGAASVVIHQDGTAVALWDQGTSENKSDVISFSDFL